MQGLIVENIANLYKVKIGKQIYDATARGKLKKDDISPVVGDFVECEILDEDTKKAVIKEINKRKVFIKRPKMANLTQLIFVVSSKNPKPDLLMLDKQLAFAEYLGINSVIVLNKIDLDKQDAFMEIAKIYENIGYKVIKTNAKDGIGVEELKHILKNNVSAFSGNSGVGKSTLINCIFDEAVTKEGEISFKNKKGKNTTTAISLYEIEENAYIADTPGFSTFDINEISYKDLDKYFKEFKNSIIDCEFVGCTHIKEEKCGVKEKLEKGDISNSRYENYCKIYLELKDREEHKW